MIDTMAYAEKMQWIQSVGFPLKAGQRWSRKLIQMKSSAGVCYYSFYAKKTQKQKQYDTQVMRFYDKLRPKATAKCEGAGESHSSLQEQRFSTLASESAQEFAP